MGALVFLVGLIFVALGAPESCFVGYCHGSSPDVNIAMLVGLAMISVSLIIWAMAMTAAAICWHGQASK